MFAPYRRWSCLAVFFALLTPARSARASSRVETSTTTIEPVDEVDVSAPRPVSPASVDPTATSAKVSAERIASAKARGDDVALVADSVAGARVLDLGGTVADRRISVRGGSPAQALLIVDGVRLSSPFATGLDLGMISLESLDSIELVRGGAGAVLGAGALTGALVLETKRAGDRRSESFLLSYGTLGTTRVAASERVKPISITGSFERTAGDFEYVSRIRGLEDRAAVRENSDAARGSLALRADGSIGVTALSFVAGGALRDGGVPGLETQEDRIARERRGSAQARAALVRSLGASTTDRVSAAVFGSVLDVDYARPSIVDPDFAHTTFNAFGAESALSLSWLEGHVARAAASIEREASDSTEHGSPSRMRASAAISDELVWSSLTLFASVRGEYYSDASLALLPRAGVSIFLGDFTLSLGLGRSLRAPAIDELYHPPEPGFSGNPRLVPETAWEAEASLAYAGRSLSARASVFGRTVFDTILYVNRNAFEVRPENAGDTRAVGAELEASIHGELAGLALRSESALSLLWSELAATGEPVPTQPKWSAAETVSASRAGVSVETTLRAIAPTTANLQGTLEVPAYVRWDVALTYAPIEGATIAIACANVLDDRTLVTVHKVPLPGRTVFASLRIETEAAP